MQVSFRIPETMAKQIDQIAEQKTAAGGVPINRTQVVVLALREWIAEQEQRASTEKEQESEIRTAAVKLGIHWAKKIARPAEKKKLARLIDEHGFLGHFLDAKFHGWWHRLVADFPSLGKVSEDDSEFADRDGNTCWSMPAVDRDVAALLEDNDEMYDFCLAFCDAANAAAE